MSILKVTSLIFCVPLIPFKRPDIFMKITNIDFEQSLSRRRLIFKVSRSYLFDLIFQIFINLVLLLNLVISFRSFFEYGVNEKSFVLIFLLFVLSFNYELYLKLTEKRLGVLPTRNTATFNRDKILALAKEAHWEIRKNSNGIIITFEDCGDRGLGNKKQLNRVFLLSGNEVFFTIFTERNKVNFPSPFSRAYLKADLKKALSQPGN